MIRWTCCGLLSLLLALAEMSTAQTTYRGISPTALAPVTFCAYSSSSPWRRRLPDNPAQRRPGDDTKARAYVTNAGSSRPFWKTVGNNEYAGCQPPYTCEGPGGFPVFAASTSDHRVTFRCRCGETNYGCWKHDANVCQGNANGGWEYQGYAPTNLFGGNNVGTDDVNWAIVQPNGDVIETYHCQIHQTVGDGALISSNVGSEGICQNSGNYVGAMLLSNLTTDKGTNGAINSGPNALAIGLKYAHVGVANPQPNSAIWMNTSCNNNDFVYPASSATRPCRNPEDGLRTGAHLQLAMTHAQIDAAISAGTIQAPWRGILYAAHDYGIYLGDTGCGLGDEAPAFGCAWLENATQVVVNGGQNPWIKWFQSLGTSDAILYANPFLPFAEKIIVVDDCYATGTCPDSPPPDLDCGGYVTHRPPPHKLRRLP